MTSFKQKSLRIAIINPVITPNNPAGSCDCYLLESLCKEFEFSVFASELQCDTEHHVEWIRIPSPHRPLLAGFCAFRICASWIWRRNRPYRDGTYDIVQTNECASSIGNVRYVHFCHRAFLTRHWKKARPRGIRFVLYRLDYALRARLEKHDYEKARHIVVPSAGLARELKEEYPCLESRITVIPNPVDTEVYAKPNNFDRVAARSQVGVGREQFVVSFVALGQFERKGLPLLIQAFESLRDENIVLLVVGGNSGLIKQYRRRARRAGVESRIKFAGFQRDPRPALWLSDAFALPSHYEVFPLVVLQAAAAGLPLIVTNLNGVEEYVSDGVEGFVVTPSPDRIADAILKLSKMRGSELERMAENACRAAQAYSVENFVSKWKQFYLDIADDARS